ncbi:L-rhamnose mutarotase [Aquisalinus flavus]|uniref:L-rhamnose mutarotase n=1 Tax=Aquisalinus flavus TaxID=1526572 RepID=A0A8J2V5X2_9PROT|nr:L-rhamnose mutarotase [Aquisalinus flavus]MBD0426005.1 L-rhamnose mutarotase [Aquisalinus flavus]UNE48403.1 L-rhamnose mutarotase [Aquisalinus flavus]GGD11489.1 hypothetical protein GCM10011342_20350 [Aquisalinus flavus]
MQRYGWVIRVKPEKLGDYRRLHKQPWPEVLMEISDCHIRNYTIFLREPENLLFGYFEYTGDDFDADMARMSEDPRTREWWSLTDPCQVPLESLEDGEWWAPMEELFHHD